MGRGVAKGGEPQAPDLTRRICLHGAASVELKAIRPKAEYPLQRFVGFIGSRMTPSVAIKHNFDDCLWTARMTRLKAMQRRRFRHTSFSRLAAAIVLSAMLAGGNARARFGKSGNSGSQSGSGSGGGGHAASPAPSGGGGNYVPGGGGGYYYPRYRTYYPGYPGRFYGSPYWYSPYWFGWGFGYYPYFYSEPAPPTISYVEPPPREPESPIKVSVALDGQTVKGYALRKGYAVGATLGVEARRVGFIGQFTGISLPTDDGSPGRDRIGLLNAHLTYALFTGTQGRLRVEGGIDTAFAPSVTLIGPGLGISGAATIIRPLGIEAAVRFTPTPYTQVDAMAGLTVALGPVALRGGWRRIWLNDNGNADPTGIAHQDLFSGPYVGLSATF